MPRQLMSEENQLILANRREISLLQRISKRLSLKSLETYAPRPYSIYCIISFTSYATSNVDSINVESQSWVKWMVSNFKPKHEAILKVERYVFLGSILIFRNVKAYIP